MKKTLASLAVCAAALLAGCAPVERAPDTSEAIAAADGQKPVPLNEPLTGSRIPKRQTSERLLKMTGNADYRESTQVRSLGNEVGNKSY
jgi:hypothetical protein